MGQHPSRCTHDDSQHRHAPATGPTVALRWSDGRPVVGLSAEVDVAVTAQLQAVGRILARDGRRAAAVDAAGVTFLDVAGLRALLDLAGPDGSLLVLHPSPAVLRLLDLFERSGLGPAVLRAGPREEAVVLRDAPAPPRPPAAAVPVVPGVRRPPGPPR